KDSILDILAEDSRGRFYNLEIQRDTTPDHPRRTRLYGAMVDGEYLQKGEDYDAMPEVYVIYISRTDLWKMGRMETPVKKYLEGQREDEQYDDGQHVIYVNAAVDDGSKKAALLHYFKTADPDDMSQGPLSRRVCYLKREEGGLNEMCEYSQRIYNGGKEEGRREGKSEGQLLMKKAMILSMKESGIDEAMIERILKNVQNNKELQ
ncbi:MAG: PD-(D/E)XK nuclease family transposase, partial [Clostridiales bacterium]|nr:PD-(D/E)XK nuclease family transposase [Clostridiales bacterium]